MKIALVKIDVAAADLGRSAARVYELADGGVKRDKGLLWVFNLANDLNARCRDLRFWRPELIARVQMDDRYDRWEIGQVIANILPETREKFHAGEVDALLQIRPNSRIAYGAELKGEKSAGRNSYSHAALAEFLQRRWLGNFAANGKAAGA